MTSPYPGNQASPSSTPNSPYPGNQAGAKPTPDSPYPGNQSGQSKTPGSLLPGNQGQTLPKSQRVAPGTGSNSDLVWPATQEWVGPFLMPWTSRTLHDWLVFGIGILFTIIAIVFLLSHEARDVIPVAKNIAASAA